MRSTFFLILLVIAFCNTEKLSPIQSKPEFIQLVKDPKVEGIFATISLSLRDDNDNGHGFNRILSLLTSLVDSAREQKHVNQKIWERTNAQCNVGRYGVKEHQSYFDGTISNLGAGINELGNDIIDITGLIESRKANSDTYNSILAAERARHAVRSDKEVKLQAFFDETIRSIADAITLVNDWTPANANTAFLQNKLNSIAAAYKKINNFHMTIPTKFVQLINDSKIKQRLLEWLGELKVHFEAGLSGIKASAEGRQAERANIEADIESLAKDMATDAHNLGGVLVNLNEVQTAFKINKEKFEALSANNVNLAKTLEDWCQVEEKNANDALEACKKNLQLFREVRNYFTDHYKEISGFIKSKYNKH